MSMIYIICLYLPNLTEIIQLQESAEIGIYGTVCINIMILSVTSIDKIVKISAGKASAHPNSELLDFVCVGCHVPC